MKFSEFITESNSQLKGYSLYLTTREEFANAGHFFDEAKFIAKKNGLTIRTTFTCKDFDKQTQLKLYKAYEDSKDLNNPLLTI